MTWGLTRNSHSINMNNIVIIIVLLATCLNPIYGWTFSKSARTAKVIKEELLALSRKVNRGVSERLEDRQQIIALFEELEGRNPLKVTLTNPLLNGVWELEYSTSEGTIGKKGPKKVGKILQTIDVKGGRVQNDDAVLAFGLLTVPRKAVAAITGVDPPQRVSLTIPWNVTTHVLLSTIF